MGHTKISIISKADQVSSFSWKSELHSLKTTSLKPVNPPSQHCLQFHYKGWNSRHGQDGFEEKQALHWDSSIKRHLVFQYGHRILASEHVSSTKSRWFHLCLLWMKFWEKTLRAFSGFMYLASPECAHSQTFRRARNSADGNFSKQ